MWKAGILILAVAWLTGCAGTARAQVSIEPRQADVYGAVVKALVRNAFQVTHTDPDAGIIAADWRVKNLGTNREGREGRVTVLVEDHAGSSVLSVTWTPPQFAVGTFHAEHDEFVRGLSAVLPGAKIVSNY
jgi:hypothetical protein